MTQEEQGKSAAGRPTRRPWMLAGAVLTLTLGVGYFVGRTIDRGPKLAAAPLAIGEVPIPADVPRKGAPVPKVTLVEVGDFQCSYCGSAAPALKKLADRFSDDVAFAFLPVAAGAHERALPAAIAAIAAARQDKFWPYHDRLFANQAALADADLERYARDVGLDVDRFKRDIADPRAAEQMAANLRLAKERLAVTGTPTFFVNGRRIAGAPAVDSLEGIIQAQLGSAKELMAKRTPLAEVSAKLTAKELMTAGAQAAKAGSNGAPVPGAPVQRVQVAVGSAPTMGVASATVTIVEFSDFECPFCGGVTADLKRLEEQFEGQVRVAFKHFPLSFHAHAPLAAQAALAANEQGKFWPYHDKLFANQKALDREALERYATEVGLDLKKFRAALDSGRLKARVEEDTKQAAALGVRGTPTFFINGRRFAGALPYEGFKKTVEEELKEVKTKG